jgi:hypothetical protein
MNSIIPQKDPFFETPQLEIPLTKPKQRIAIDTVFFNRGFSGITRVWITILNNIISSSTSQYPFEIILFIRGKAVPSELDKHLYKNNFTYIHINEFNYVTMYQDIDYLDQLCKTHQIAFFFSTYFTYTTIIPNIILIHDMIPEVFKFHRNHMWIQKDLAIKNASAFITISNTSQTDLIKFYPHIKNNNYPVYIIPNAISITNPPQYELPFLNNFLASHGILPKKYIFTIASNTESYKNMQLITDFSTKYSTQLQSLLKTRIPVIALVNTPIKNGFEITNNILYISRVPDTILNTLYKYALAFVCPSKYEGFGLPVFEAFTHDTPVITLNIPIFQELCKDAVHFISNDIDQLYNTITTLLKPNPDTLKRIINGRALVTSYNESNIQGYANLFSSNTFESLIIPKSFLNIIIQSYNEGDPARRAELEHCIIANLDNPYLLALHDFGGNSCLPANITQHPKYIHVTTQNPNTPTSWLKYKTAFLYANNTDNQAKYGNYWGLINCDIFLDASSNWHLIRSYLNSDYIAAISRHEYIPGVVIDTDINPEPVIKMDEKFSKTLHSNTQDGWFFSTPLKPTLLDRIANIDFEIGLLGCDNAIADRLVQCGYKIINPAIRFKIVHYDIARGKNSSNFLEKHNNEHKTSSTKAKNTHPEATGSYLVPNYDQMVDTQGEIDLISYIRNLGGISNWERYKIICELFSSRIIIQNPE